MIRPKSLEMSKENLGKLQKQLEEVYAMIDDDFNIDDIYYNEY